MKNALLLRTKGAGDVKDADADADDDDGQCAHRRGSLRQLEFELEGLTFDSDATVLYVDCTVRLQH